MSDEDNDGLQHLRLSPLSKVPGKSNPEVLIRMELIADTFRVRRLKAKGKFKNGMSASPMHANIVG